MLNRVTLLPTALAAAVGLPYLMSSSESLLSGTASATAEYATGEAGQWPSNLADQEQSPVAGGTTARLSTAVPMAGESVGDLSEVFRFDATPQWILGRWPRVSTRLAELDLQGYRIPLVTGTAEHDLAGALTYYFDEQQQLQRITFYGTTGDPSKLVALAATRYGLLRQFTDDPGLYLYQTKWNGKPHSELQVRPSKVIRAGSPHTRFEVALVLLRPTHLQ